MAPQQVVGQLLKAVDNATVIRGLATTFRVERADSLGVTSLDSDRTIPSGRPNCRPAIPMRAWPSASASFVRTVATSCFFQPMLRMRSGIEGIIMARLAYKMGIKHENAFLNGDGDKEAFGHLHRQYLGHQHGARHEHGQHHHSDHGGQPEAGTRQAQSPVPQQCPSCRWVFHRDVVTEIALLKDTTNRYLLTDSIRENRGGNAARQTDH